MIQCGKRERVMQKLLLLIVAILDTSHSQYSGFPSWQNVYNRHGLLTRRKDFAHHLAAPPVEVRYRQSVGGGGGSGGVFYGTSDHSFRAAAAAGGGVSTSYPSAAADSRHHSSVAPTYYGEQPTYKTQITYPQVISLPQYTNFAHSSIQQYNGHNYPLGNFLPRKNHQQPTGNSHNYLSTQQRTPRNGHSAIVGGAYQPSTRAQRPPPPGAAGRSGGGGRLPHIGRITHSNGGGGRSFVRHARCDPYRFARRRRWTAGGSIDSAYIGAPRSEFPLGVLTNKPAHTQYKRSRQHRFGGGLIGRFRMDIDPECNPILYY